MRTTSCLCCPATVKTERGQPLDLINLGWEPFSYVGNGLELYYICPVCAPSIITLTKALMERFTRVPPECKLEYFHWSGLVSKAVKNP